MGALENRLIWWRLHRLHGPRGLLHDCRRITYHACKAPAAGHRLATFTLYVKRGIACLTYMELETHIYLIPRLPISNVTIPSRRSQTLYICWRLDDLRYEFDPITLENK